MSAGSASSGRRHPRSRAVLAAVLATVALAIAGCAGGYTQPATNVGETTATVKALVFSTDDATISYWFEYGPTASYGSKTPDRSLAISDRDNHPVSENLSGLDPGTTHHYRVCARDQNEVVVCANDRTFTTAGGVGELSVDAPSLYPDFDPSIRDYVLGCTGGPVEVTAGVPRDTRVSVDGAAARNGTFTAEVPLQPNQRFSIRVEEEGGLSTYHVRCLPDDFPEWSFERFAAPRQQFYVVAVRDYVFALDDHGVPIWWFDDGGAPTDAKLLPDGSFSWGTDRNTAQARYEVRALDGQKLHDLQTAGTMTDAHDIQLLPNGNYLMMSYKERAGSVDLSSFPGGPADATVVDAELQEIDPDDPADPVWIWNSKDHVGLDEIGHWWEDWVGNRLINGAYDIVHINSAEVVDDGDSALISMRHTDGVYKIDRASGEIVWKLGGTATDESLEVLGDPEGDHPLAGQHDARLLPDGTITIFDNGAFVSDTSPFHRTPRAVRYEIDESAGTATLLESVSDPDVDAAICCGSARRDPSGSWLVGWGGIFNPISEFRADGTRTFKLDFPGTWSYRAHPVASGELSRSALRGGMDAQWPR